MPVASDKNKYIKCRRIISEKKRKKKKSQGLGEDIKYFQLKKLKESKISILSSLKSSNVWLESTHL